MDTFLVGDRQPNVLNDEQFDKLRHANYTLMDGLSQGDKVRITLYRWIEGELVEVEEDYIFHGLFVNYYSGVGLDLRSLDNRTSISMSGNLVLRMEKQ